MKIRAEEDFISIFDETSGRYMRTGLLREGKDTGIDPFMASSRSFWMWVSWGTVSTGRPVFV